MKESVSKTEAALILGVSRGTIHNMVKRGELPCCSVLGKPRIPRDALERLGKSTALALRRVSPVEVLAKPQPELLLGALIEQKIAEMAAQGKAEAIFEPFFRSKGAADEIRRHQTLPEQSKWKLYYEKWGCLICETKKARQGACGMCVNCYHRTAQRLQFVIKQAEDAMHKRGALIVHDLTAEAQAALEPPETESEE